MSSWLPFVVVGVTNGALYGLAGTGLVLTYKTSGIFNFAYGAVAAAGAYLFFWLNVILGMPWPLALPLVAGVFGVVAGIVLARVAAVLRNAPAGTTVVATVGLLLAIQSAITLIAGPTPRQFPTLFATSTFAVAGVNVSYQQLATVIVAAALTAGVFLLFKSTFLGLAMRGVVEDPDLLAMSATDPVKVRTAAWVIGSVFAAIVGIFIAPVLGLDSLLLTLLVVQAFGAAAIGRLSSLPLTFAGGMVVGVLAALTTRAAAGIPALNGLSVSVPFLILFVVLLVTPKRLLADFGRATFQARVSGMPQRTALALGAAGLLVAAALPLVAASRTFSLTTTLVMVLLFLSLALLLSLSGQVSLAHAAFAAIGASTLSHLTLGAGLPWLVALLLAGAFAIPAGAVVAIPAIRLSGIYLALATFGFGILMQQLLYGRWFMFGLTASLEVPRPAPFGEPLSDRSFYYTVLAIVVVGVTAAIAVSRSRLGRLLRAMADSPRGLSTLGTSINVSKVLVFCLSAFTAGIAGALFAAAGGAINGLAFGPFTSLTWFVVLGLFGSGLLRPAILAALAFTLPQSLLGSVPQERFTFVFGVSALVAALITAGAGREWLGRQAARSHDRLRHGPVTARVLKTPRPVVGSGVSR